ncbi:hypothetical protein, partial [Shewanella xiamenensis]|uniref:hypothetical protein n=1 Tax=Shewanella xiamenensis TaxID=332186 RepID=UPI002E7BA0FE
MTLTPEEESQKAELKAELLSMVQQKLAVDHPIVAELLSMVQQKLAVDHPIVLDWLERAANLLGKDQLESNERWVHNP